MIYHRGYDAGTMVRIIFHAFEQPQEISEDLTFVSFAYFRLHVNTGSPCLEGEIYLNKII